MIRYDRLMSLFAENRAYLLFTLIFRRHLTYLNSNSEAEIDVKANALTKRGFEWNATVEHFLMNVRTIETVVGNN